MQILIPLLAILAALATVIGAVITGGKVIEGVYRGYTTAGAPVAGTNEVQTLTIGGTPTAGAGSTFTIAFDGATSGPILWSATNATLLAAINAALDATPTIGVGGFVATAGTLTAGIGTILLTAGGNLARRAIPTATIGANNLTGTAPTLAIAETTPGVDASGRGAAIGAILIRLDTGVAHSNTGTALSPTWTPL